MIHASKPEPRTHTFILAGGQGERLYPLTQSRPKPVISFGGTFRIIDFTLSNCLHSGLNRVSLLTQYRAEELHRYIREGWMDLWTSQSSDRDPLVCVPPVSGKRYRGTADAVFQNIALIGTDSDLVLVLSADHIYQMDYRELLLQHIETNADLTVATVAHPLCEASKFGVVEVDEWFGITSFEEKPANPRPLPCDPSTALVSMGVYVFKKTVLAESLQAICDSGLGSDFGQHIIPFLIASVRAQAYDFREPTQRAPLYWRDIGTIDSYHAASMDLVGPNAKFDPYANERWPSRPTRHPSLNDLEFRWQGSTRIDATARVERTVLSPGVQVQQNATLEESILMPGVRVGEDASLRRVIVEECVQIPAGFCAGFDNERDRQHHTVSDTGIVVIDRDPPANQHDVWRDRFYSVQSEGVRVPFLKKARLSTDW